MSKKSHQVNMKVRTADNIEVGSIKKEKPERRSVVIRKSGITRPSDDDEIMQHASNTAVSFKSASYYQRSHKSLRNNFENKESRKAILRNTLAEIEQ